MAYMSQEMKKSLSVGIKKVLKKYNVKGSIAVRHYSKLVVTIRESDFDFDLRDRGYVSVNQYSIGDNYDGEQAVFLKELRDAMMSSSEFENHDRSDSMTDYFDVGWYIDISIGKFDKPYIHRQAKQAA